MLIFMFFVECVLYILIGYTLLKKMNHNFEDIYEKNKHNVSCSLSLSLRVWIQPLFLLKTQFNPLFNIFVKSLFPLHLDEIISSFCVDNHGYCHPVGLFAHPVPQIYLYDGLLQLVQSNAYRLSHSQQLEIVIFSFDSLAPPTNSSLSSWASSSRSSAKSSKWTLRSTRTGTSFTRNRWANLTKIFSKRSWMKLQPTFNPSPKKVWMMLTTLKIEASKITAYTGNQTI